MTITFDNLPDEIERALRERAAAEHKSLDAAVLDALARGLGVEPQHSGNGPDDSDIIKRRDLTGIAGLRLIDDEMKTAFEEQRRIDPELWK